MVLTRIHNHFLITIEKFREKVISHSIFVVIELTFSFSIISHSKLSQIEDWLREAIEDFQF